MTEAKSNSSPLDPLKRYVPLAVWAVVIVVLLLIPLRVVEYGYLPGDDALRSSAKAVSGKSWQEILVLNPVYKIDHEFGWSWLLRRICLWTNWGADKLVVFSMMILFLFASALVLPWLKRPEAWLATLMAAMLASDVPQRFLLGRPFVVTAAGLMAILFLWQKYGSSPPKAWMLALMTVFFAASTFFHGPWYLWVLIFPAFFLAGEFRWCFWLGACWVAGVLLGSALTGHPIAYPLQAVKLARLAVGMHEIGRTMAVELQPSNGDILAVGVFGALLALRQMAKLTVVPLVKNPAFWLVFLGWVLGFKVSRFWDDWGWPALMVLVTWDLQLFLQTRFAPESFQRLGFILCLAGATFFVVTNDAGSRWTGSLTQQYLTESDPDVAGWLPDSGGIFYTADMTLFYQTFFKNPHGDWRYMLGFEPTWMPKQDFETYQSILWNYGDPKAYEPWVRQMKPADRLVIRGDRGSQPGIPQLEWNYAVSGIWVGRLPRPVAPGTAPPMIPATEPQYTATNALTVGSAE